MGMFGLPIGMIWPKMQEIMKDLCTDDSFIGVTFTFTPDGLLYKGADGVSLLIPPETSYEEFGKLLEESGLLKNK